MKLKQVVDTLEGLPEWAKELYTKGDDGKFYLEVEGLGEMRTALKEANGEAAKRRKELEKFKDIDPEKYAELMKAEEERVANDAKKNGEWEKLRQQMSDKHTKEITERDKTIAQLRKGWENDAVDARLEAAILAEKGNPRFLKHALRERVKVEYGDDGAMKIVVLGEDGSPMVADASGKLAGFGDLVKHFKEQPEWGGAFEGVGSSGGGAHTTDAARGGKAMARSQFDKLDPAAQRAHVMGGGKVTD